MSFKILIFCTNEQNLLRVEMAELLLFWQQLTGISCTFPPFKAPFKMYRSTSEMMPSGLDDLEVLINVTQKEVKNNDKRNCIYKLTLSLLVLKVTKSVYKQENNKLTVTGSCWQRASNKDRGLVSYCPDTLTKEQKKKKENNRKKREKNLQNLPWRPFTSFTLYTDTGPPPLYEITTHNNNRVKSPAMKRLHSNRALTILRWRKTKRHVLFSVRGLFTSFLSAVESTEKIPTSQCALSCSLSET